MSSSFLVTAGPTELYIPIEDVYLFYQRPSQAQYSSNMHLPLLKLVNALLTNEGIASQLDLAWNKENKSR